MHEVHSRRRCVAASVSLVVGAALLASGTARGIGIGQVDTFAINTAGWQEGVASPNPPTRVASGGPAGAGDAFLQNISSGGSGAGSKQIMFNQVQWTGNFTTAGVGAISLDAKDLGTTDSNIRLAFRSATSVIVTTESFAVPAGSAWMSHTFPLRESDLTVLTGSYADAMSGVTSMRILSNSIVDEDGESIAMTLGIDNVRALPEPITGFQFAIASMLVRRKRR